MKRPTPQSTPRSKENEMLSDERIDELSIEHHQDARAAIRAALAALDKEEE